jgi:hypothetical protein
MWQHHYVIHTMRMEQLRAEADRERRWHLADIESGRVAQVRAPGRPRALLARGIAALSRGSGRAARRLDGRVMVDLGTERLLRDA